ncbi:YdcF family protein [Lysobacter sp. KIS68-7]|uniref:YdcF family protein n=1 Tax=Lysobacter sp. KIS68-7 TaxID=2904252 RepID=UPI001E554034|nr:YdcF family protein [Lysobacter sp. KIS68-7]UHQ20349.1 YdcF family protein [Lysobacter sp. KIS68-7]
MPTRTAHRLRLAVDLDVIHTGLVTLAACTLSAGLVYVAYFLHVLRVARRAPTTPEHGDCVLVFGKHAPRGRIDADFALRLERAATLWRERPPRDLILLGGGAPDEPSEAEIARGALLARGLAAGPALRLEAQSRDTLQNLRNARELLVGETPRRVTLLSNRYHLARCALFARQLGYDWELCAAEARLPMRPSTLFHLAGEAFFVCWSDLGTRWARFIGDRRMLARVT